MNLDGMSINTPELKLLWSKDRALRLGASDACAAVGLSEYQSPLSLYLEKRGQKPPGEKKINRKMRWGILHEPTMMSVYQEETGKKLIANQMYLISKNHSWQCATLDALREDNRLVEFKTTDASLAHKWGVPGTDEIPPGYLIQVYHQMLVAESHGITVDWADVCVLIGGNDFRIYRVLYNKKAMDHILSLEKDFMDCVKTGKPPKLNHKKDSELLVYIFPEVAGSIDLDESVSELAREYHEAKQRVKEYTCVANDHRTKLLLAMGDNQTGKLSGGGVLTRRIVRREEKIIYQKASEYVMLTVKGLVPEFTGEFTEETSE